MIVSHPRAVYSLECSCDQGIPANDLERARAIDAAFEAAHPEWHKLEENARYAREAREWMHGQLAAFRASYQTPSSIQRNAESVCRILATFRTHNRLAIQFSSRKAA